jgi:hypothetical protein
MTTSILTSFLLMAALLASAVGQNTSPGLQQRPAGDPDGQHVTVIREGGKTVLPDDAYGLYRFSDHENAFGEGLQINEQFGEVSGYLTIPDGKGSHARFSSYFLTRVTGGNGHFAFVTRLVHGVSYSFDGHVQRGPGMSPAQDAFYVLDGTLNTLDQAGNTTQSRKITLNLTAQH